MQAIFLIFVVASQQLSFLSLLRGLSIKVNFKELQNEPFISSMGVDCFHFTDHV